MQKLVATLLALAVWLASTTFPASAEVFRDESDRYQIEVPEGWRITHTDPNLSLVSYAPEEFLEGSLLPPGSAQVVIREKPENVPATTAREWVDYVLSHSRTAPDVVETVHYGETSCIELRAIDEIVQGGLTYGDRSCFLEKNGRLFRVGIEYRLESEGENHLRAYETVIRSLTVF